MKLLAQHGFAPADKLDRGVQEGFVEGVVLSSRYLTLHSAREHVQRLLELNQKLDVLLDPEYFAIQQLGMPNAQLGRLADEDQWSHFVPHRLTALLTDKTAIESVVAASFEDQQSIGCTGLIAPNIYVSRSFDSIEAAVALSFITQAKSVAEAKSMNMPVFATLCVTRNALLNQQEFEAFLATLTVVDPKPDGVYVLVAAGTADERGQSSRAELVVPEVVGNWMLLNFSLALNGMSVINGCSDLLSPLLGIAHGTAGASGWWSGLQFFSMGRYVRNEGGGQQPLKRYVSARLLNRVTVNEREAFVAVVPTVANGLVTDSYYEGREPSRTEEALQSWDAIRTLNRASCTGDLVENLRAFEGRLVAAEDCYQELASAGFSERYESNREYLAALRGGIRHFRERAELGSA
jgi:hypothetical protein